MKNSSLIFNSKADFISYISYNMGKYIDGLSVYNNPFLKKNLKNHKIVESLCCASLEVFEEVSLYKIEMCYNNLRKGNYIKSLKTGKLYNATFCKLYDKECVYETYDYPEQLVVLRNWDYENEFVGLEKVSDFPYELYSHIEFITDLYDEEFLKDVIENDIEKYMSNYKKGKYLKFNGNWEYHNKKNDELIEKQTNLPK